MKLDATYDLEGERKDERIGQVVDGLEHGDVLHEGAVPYDTEKDVLTSTTSIKVRISVSTSDLDLALATS